LRNDRPESTLHYEQLDQPGDMVFDFLDRSSGDPTFEEGVSELLCRS